MNHNLVINLLTGRAAAGETLRLNNSQHKARNGGDPVPNRVALNVIFWRKGIYLIAISHVNTCETLFGITVISNIPFKRRLKTHLFKVA